MITTQINYNSPIANKYSATFNGRRLYKLNLKNISEKNEELISAFFTQISTKKDLEKLQKVTSVWKNTTFWHKIIENFKETLAMPTRKYRDLFFIIEAPQLKKPEERIRAIVQTSPFSGEFNVDLLQSSSQIKKLEQLKGAGTAIIRGLCQFAHEKEYEYIGLLASKNAVNWYKKLGFTSKNDLCLPGFILEKDNFLKFITKTEKEYGKLIQLNGKKTS